MPHPSPLRAAQMLESSQRVSIACFGDSITGVYYHTGGRRAWCDVLGIALRRIYPAATIEMINAGISGNTTADALSRMERDVLAHRPDLIAVMFGMNDVVRVPPDAYRANLQELIRRARAHRAEIILMTPNAIDPDDSARPPEKLAAYAQIVRELAAENHLLLADPHRAFEAVRTGQPAEWMRLMSDSAHPNMRGHRLFASLVATAISGREVPLPELPRLSPALPLLQSLLAADALVRITAMNPLDSLIETALSTHFPQAKLEISTWDPSGKSIGEIRDLAQKNGWAKYRDHPDLPKPDLTLVAVPANLPGPLDKAHYRAYGWVLNWSQSFGADPRADCLAILPSVFNAHLTADEAAAEAFARNVILDRDLPFIQRAPGDTTAPQALITRELARLLTA